MFSSNVHENGFEIHPIYIDNILINIKYGDKVLIFSSQKRAFKA